MANIRGRNTGPEVRLRKALWKAGQAAEAALGQVLKDGDPEAIRLIRARVLDLRAEVVLADCTTPPPIGPAGGRALAELGGARSDRLRILTESEAPALLVLTDTWYPGWRASVDGQPATLWRADHAFRAVTVPAGRHEVELRFAPRSVLAGALVSALSAALVVAVLVRRRRERAP